MAFKNKTKKKKVLVKDVFGMLKGWKISAQKAKDDMRKGW